MKLPEIVKRPNILSIEEQKEFLENCSLTKEDLIELASMEMHTTIELRKVKRSLLRQIKELSQMNGELRREIHDLNDRYDEVTKSWFSKLFVWKRKLFKLSIRNPFYIQS
tara:strand:+ start:107 stop:436 length:330 start_codon:yes stop_codon:yes gene_type:complete